MDKKKMEDYAPFEVGVPWERALSNIATPGFQVNRPMSVDQWGLGWWGHGSVTAAKNSAHMLGPQFKAQRDFWEADN